VHLSRLAILSGGFIQIGHSAAAVLLWKLLLRKSRLFRLFGRSSEDCELAIGTD
jgi:hypothetical protein